MSGESYQVGRYIDKEMMPRQLKIQKHLQLLCAKVLLCI